MCHIHAYFSCHTDMRRLTCIFSSVILCVYSQEPTIQLQAMPDSYIPANNNPEPTPTIQLQVMENFVPTEKSQEMTQNLIIPTQNSVLYKLDDFMKDDSGNLQLFLDPDTGGKV